MAKSDRDFKTNIEHWNIVVQYLEQNPILLKSKFSNFDGDNEKLKKLWQQLATHLNSLGHGTRPVDKWQLAIGRRKSKIKARAAARRQEMLKTGGGPHKTPPLDNIEERLMAVLGWKAITGDENLELGMHAKSSMSSTFDCDRHNGVDTTTTTYEIKESSLPPPLVSLAQIESEEVTSIAQKREMQTLESTPKKKRKLAKTTEKSRKFVSLNKMHNETLSGLTKIEQNTARIADTIERLSADIRKYIDFLMSKYIFLNYYVSKFSPSNILM